MLPYIAPLLPLVPPLSLFLLPTVLLPYFPAHLLFHSERQGGRGGLFSGGPDDPRPPRRLLTKMTNVYTLLYFYFSIFHFFTSDISEFYLSLLTLPLPYIILQFYFSVVFFSFFNVPTAPLSLFFHFPTFLVPASVLLALLFVFHFRLVLSFYFTIPWFPNF